jgi:hypothetical protein
MRYVTHVKKANRNSPRAVIVVQKRLQDIRGLLFAGVPRAKAKLSKHCTAITLTPEGSTFRITGTGTYSADVRMVPGARYGPNVCPSGSGGWLLRDNLPGAVPRYLDWLTRLPENGATFMDSGKDNHKRQKTPGDWPAQFHRSED